MNTRDKATDALIDRAKPFYDEQLPYHGWSHAEEVMSESDRIIRQMGSLGANINRNITLIAAAWHDAGHEDEQASDFESKEHYAVWLVKETIGNELEAREVDLIERSILATRFGVSRLTPEEIILHYADMANVGYDYDRFLEHTLRLWREYGCPEWHSFVNQSSRVILQTIDEAGSELPLIGLPIDGPDSFPVSARANLERLVRENTPQ